MPHSLFRSYRAYLQSKFGPGTIRKVTVDGGFSCPNIDGTVGAGGCAYCNNESFSPAFALRRREGIIPVRDQVAAGIKRLAASRKADRFIVYFQPFTNTHAPVDALKRLYDEALDHPAVAGLAVGTRPDCVDEEKLALLENYASRMPVIVEYGLESAHDRTLAALNRGHDFAAFAAAMRLSAGRRFDIGVHIILNLPGESRDDMNTTAERLATFQFHVLKIHNLYIAKGTRLARDYASGTVCAPAREEYIAAAADFLERMPPDVAIERLTGNAPGDLLIAPDWCRNASAVARAVEAELLRRGTRQGGKYRRS